MFPVFPQHFEVELLLEKNIRNFFFNLKNLHASTSAESKASVSTATNEPSVTANSRVISFKTSLIASTAYLIGIVITYLISRASAIYNASSIASASLVIVVTADHSSAQTSATGLVNATHCIANVSTALLSRSIPS